MDEKYQLPTGHINGNESLVEAMARELKEEINIEVVKEVMKIVHICHRVPHSSRTIFQMLK